MTLDSSKLLAPAGPVTIALLAGDADAKAFGKKRALATLAAYVEAAYLDERVAAMADGPTKDKAARAFALWKIFDAAYVAMLNRPASLTVTEKGSHAYTTAQLEGMKAKAEQYQQEFDALIPDEASPTPTPREVAVPTFLTF